MLVDTVTNLVNIQFLKQLTNEEVKTLFFSIWNIAFEAKELQLLAECKKMLHQLYDQVKKFAQYVQETQLAFEINLLQTVMFRTLALLADLNLQTHNF